MTEFKIDKDVPIPRSGSGEPKYPWHDMEVGDSFFVPEGRPNICGSATRRYYPKRFSERKVEGGLRVWRTE